MKAFKVFDENWKCRGFQYKVGETYEIQELPVLCNTGFHACKKLLDCFNYYKFDPKNKVAEVELIGEIVGGDGDKSATNKIKIIKELNWNEVLSLVNTGDSNSGNSNSGDSNSGDSNSGDSNSGDWNSGDWNSGDWNSGDRNSGYRNSGYRNSGYRNSGDSNSGDSNSGDWNSGDWNSGYRNSGYSNSGDSNSGDWNSGDWNSGDRNSGDWNTKTPEYIYFFNQMIKYTELLEIKSSIAYNILNRFRLIKYRVRTQTGKYGDYRYLSYKSSFKHFWRNLSFSDRKEIMSMPYFDKDVFFEITGVKIR